MIFPRLGSYLRKWSAMASAEKPLVDGLKKTVEERRKNFERFARVDLIQLLLQEDREHQMKQNVKQK